MITSAFSGLARSDSTPRIEGIANYLAALSTKDFDYIVERRLLDNTYLQCFLPNVYSSIETVGLMNVLNFNAEAWESQFEHDLDRYFGIAMLQVVDRTDLAALSDVSRDDYIEGFLQKFQIKSPDSGSLIDLNDISTTATTTERELINRFSDVISTYFGDLYDLQALITASEGNICDVVNDGSITVSQVITTLDGTLNTLKDSAAVFTDVPVYFDGIEVNSANIPIVLTAYTLMNATSTSDEPFEDLVSVSSSDNYEVKLLYIFNKLESAEPGLKSEKAYKRFKDFVFLSAKLADADNPASVETALTSYLADDVSFGTKRQFVFNLTGQAYFGIAYDSQLDDAIASLPVGLEGSYNWNGYPIGFMVGILDFAGPTVAAIRDDSTTRFQWEQLVSPSVGLSVGWNDLPLALTTSYQFKSDAFRIGVSLDMPLLDLSR